MSYVYAERIVCTRCSDCHTSEHTDKKYLLETQGMGSKHPGWARFTGLVIRDGHLCPTCKDLQKRLERMEL